MESLPLIIDLGNLAVYDNNVVEENSSENDREAYLKTRSEANIQYLINHILNLPVRRSTQVGGGGGQENSVALFDLPSPIYNLPREKALPKPKAQTKWEQFALKKGINKKSKDGKLIYDEISKQWVPKWGYKGANKALDNQWLVELDDEKSSRDDKLDPRKLARADRKALVQKHLRQKEKNARKKL